tara:strand:- start:391 stop:888 length:498 start_codon:yes stop_codon:yes gene_type:complete
MIKKIHHSFDKKDIVNIIKKFEIDINTDVSRTRHNICKDLLPKIDEYGLHYLYEENTEIKLTCSQRQNIIAIARQCSAYALSINHNVIFENRDKYFEQIKYLLMYGDIPSVRKAIYRCNLEFGTVFQPIVSPQILLEIERRKLLKKLSKPHFSVKQGFFKIDFEW